MPTHLPHPPPQVHRGDHYRLNFTTGALLGLLARDGARTDAELAAVLDIENITAGIPGGPAGAQWSPPNKKPSSTYRDEHPDPRVDKAPTSSADDETYPDTLRIHCTYFDAKSTRIAAILRMLDYCRLVTRTGETSTLTTLGRQVLDMAETSEEIERLRDPSGRTQTQLYLSGDSRDVVSRGYTPTFTVLPISITEAVVVASEYHYGTADPSAVLDRLPPAVFNTAVVGALRTPGLVVDIGTGDPHMDTELPIRRNLHRAPTYRQFLWILKNDPNTFVLALMSGEVTEDAARAVMTKRQGLTAAQRSASPLLAEAHRVRSIRNRISVFADIVLSGGPEAVWVAKPLNPKDVHNDVKSFIIADRPGFSDRIEQASSLAWELYDSQRVSMHDLELARETIHEGWGNGLLARDLVPEDNVIDSVAVSENALSEIEGMSYELDKAGKYVMRTADSVLAEVGIDLVPRRVSKPVGDGVDIQCRHTQAGYTCNGSPPRIVRCRNQSIGGTGYCEKHGGSYLTPPEMVNLVRTSQQKLMAASSKATEVLTDIMLNSSNDAVRLRACEQVMNRTGLSESRNLDISVDGTDRKGDAIRLVNERLEGLAGIAQETRRAILEKRDGSESEQYIIDAEVTEEAEG